jgi:hypothetical protein
VRCVRQELKSKEETSASRSEKVEMVFICPKN